LSARRRQPRFESLARGNTAYLSGNSKVVVSSELPHKHNARIAAQ
jgi:hypothetical protein